ncbi:MocR-like pyridoxine biosynthesis transcription factor PdxR [Leifsonia poae]|uniref:GntR family transcriptional regulator n=1 Tax=Leifsonia poae TaxID=110933 RepID=A0A9W6HCH1_9MICO|nr:PLP-dependent aminotransferase family protein [Leifsonia poae]GLJ77514.1 GntR family transcriptional regulator [Leifsonia poae]
MDVHVQIESRGDRADRIYRQLRDAIRDGRLRRGERLPASRDLASQLAVSRTTVTVAYERLTAEGYLASKVGSGTYVAATGAPSTVASRRAAGRGDSPHAGRHAGALPRRHWRHIDDPLWTEPLPIAYDFSVGTPDPALFPIEQWRRLVAGELRGGILRSAHYADPAGLKRLREALARHLGVARSVDAAADDVLITSGAQQAFDLIARILVDPGDLVAVEDPGYPPVRQLFETLGARVVPVPVDEHGIRVDSLPPRARLVYTTPSHQFPTGAVLSLERRTALLSWASANDAVIIEDDYDSEYRFGDRPLDPLQSLDGEGRVVYVGTFSKTMLPALRLGFLIAPASLMPALRSAKRLTDWHNDYLTQAAMARFIDSGGFARHVRQATKAYGARQRSIAAHVESLLGESMRVVPSVAGLHLCVVPADASIPFDAARVVADAAASGVAVQALSRFTLGHGAPDGLLLGFGSIAEADVPDGLRLLSRAIARSAHPQPAG